MDSRYSRDETKIRRKSEDIKHTMRLGRGQGDRGTAGFRGSAETNFFDQGQ